MAALVTSVLLVGALVGCSSSTPAPAPSAKSLEQVLAEAKAGVDAMPAVHLVLTSADLPADVTGLVGGDAVGTHAPAVKGTFQAKVRGTQADVAVVALGGKVWTKLPFTSIFVEVSPDTLGIPDPARLLDPTSGLTSLLTRTTSLSRGAQLRKGTEVLTPVSGTLPGSVLVELLRTGDAAGTFQVTYGLVEPALSLRTIQITFFFVAATTETYTVLVEAPDGPVDIRQP